MFPGLQDPVGGVPHGAGNPDGAVVPEVAANLAYDHGHTVGRKLYRLRNIEIVNGLDEPYAANLKQIVHAFTSPREPLDHRQHQPQIPLDQLFTGLPVPGLAAAEQLHGLTAFQDLQLCRVDPRNLHFPLHISASCR